MKAYLYRSGAEISPFGELAPDLEVGAQTLGAWQDEVLRRCGLEPVRVEAPTEVRDPDAHILIADDLFFTRRVLRSFLKRWERTRLSQAGLPKDSLLLSAMGTLQRYRSADGLALFDLFGVPAAHGVVELDRGGPEQRPGPTEAEPVAVAFREKVLEMPIPARVTGEPVWRHPVTSSVCLHIEHWIHVLQASRLTIQVKWVDAVVRRPLWAIGRALLALPPWPGRGRLLWRVLGVANQLGKGVDIHPTARVEGAILGPGVRVGAFAVVRASIVGAGTVIEDRATVAYSVVGARSFVSKYTLVYASSAMAEANLGMSMQMCLAGRGAGLTPRATPIDVIPGGQIRVKVGERFVPVDLSVLGSCFGHRCFVGADVYLAPGREVPNDVVIGPRPGRVLAHLPAELAPGERYWVEDGRLRSASDRVQRS